VPEASFEDDLNADPHELVDLMVAIEEEFDVKIDEEEIRQLPQWATPSSSSKTTWRSPVQLRPAWPNVHRLAGLRSDRRLQHAQCRQAILGG
jgi:hypothetical protein